MKKISKVLVLVLSAIMVLAMSASVFATEIDVKNVLDGETYTAYKILNYTNSGTAYSYYLTADQYTAIGSVLEAAGFAFVASSDGTQYHVTNAETFDAAAAAEYLGTHVSNLGNALGKFEATASDGEAVFTGLGTGYFFVTSSAGSLCALHDEKEIKTLVEKNTVPVVDKKEKTSADYVDGPVDANYGDTVHYQLTVTDGRGTDNAITLTDTMSTGLDYTAGSIKINGSSVADDADTDNWTVSISGRVITIVFKPAYVASLNENDTVIVTYDATINENAVVDSATGNENKVELDYSEQSSEDKVYVETYDFQVFKTDGTKFLDGSEFKLYDSATNGNQIILTKESEGSYYVDATGSSDTTIDINASTGCNVRGLAPGTYYLEETVVPDGYNKLTERRAVTITTGATAAVEITVINNAGTQLPSTGGIGTTIFYVVGSLLVIGCGIVLVSRRRMRDK